MEKGNIYLKVTHNAYPSFTGLEKFKSINNEEYFLQARPKWYPAATDGNELFFELLLNSEAFEFIKNIVIGGFTWDLIKLGVRKFNLLTFLTATDELLEENNNKVDLKRITLQFNDITIIIDGLYRSVTSNFTIIFKSLYEILPLLEKKGLSNIVEIRMPLFKEEQNNETRYYYNINCVDMYGEQEEEQVDDFLTYWQIKTEFGCMNFIYDVKNDVLEEYYGVY